MDLIRIVHKAEERADRGAECFLRHHPALEMLTMFLQLRF